LTRFYQAKLADEKILALKPFTRLGRFLFFRVLNKQGLSDALKNINDQKAVDAIVVGAVARWKSGWGKEKERKFFVYRLTKMLDTAADLL
jgi:hypothetical protein